VGVVAVVVRVDQRAYGPVGDAADGAQETASLPVMNPVLFKPQVPSNWM
jgi:Na+/H+-translocating membrane pyrophosphatase